MALHLSGCTYAWLRQDPLEVAIEQLAAHGFESFELTTASPHLFTRQYGPFERKQLARLCRSVGVRPISVNPGYVDINVVSTNPEIQSISMQQLTSEIELAHDLEAQYVVLIPGRTHQLSPAPADFLESLLVEVLDHLVARASELGVVLTLENSPYGFFGTSTEQLALVDRIDSDHFGMTYDVANALAIEDPVEALQRIAHRLRLVHVSDTWRNRWAHTSIGRGDVDFVAFAQGLKGIGYEGTTVYELVDGEPPGPRLAQDVERLMEAGWQPTTD